MNGRTKQINKNQKEPAKMGNGCNGGELNDNVFSVVNGQNKKVTVDAAKVAK